MCLFICCVYVLDLLFCPAIPGGASAGGSVAMAFAHDNTIQEIPRRDSETKKRLRENRAMPCALLVVDVYYHHVFSESLLVFGTPSGKNMNLASIQAPS